MKKARINFGSGNPLFGIEVDSKDLDKVIKFKVAEVREK